MQASGRRGEIVLITKGCHPAVDLKNLLGSPWTPRLTPEALRADLSESLERLHTDYAGVEIHLAAGAERQALMPCGCSLRAAPSQASALRWPFTAG